MLYLCVEDAKQGLMEKQVAGHYRSGVSYVFNDYLKKNSGNKISF